jgi:NADH-quinone oxidoreductase subunit L
MDNAATMLWLIPALPLLAAVVTTFIGKSQRGLAAGVAIAGMLGAFALSLKALVAVLGQHGVPVVHNFLWLEFGETQLQLGWVLDPLSAMMLVMVTFVGTLIFIFSIGYMAHDERFTRFFCFLSLFAAAMLGLVIANNLLLLFMCWELVGLASYLLIGFWYQKPSAAAAAKKAFITTRIGDIGLFLGLLWLYRETGTLLCYDNGAGCLEQSALTKLVGQVAFGGMAVSTVISLLLFCGAIGKSGQVPLHVWLPDAMEGPTPVSALIHAATMVAAGVFLMARVYPLLAITPDGPANDTTALQVITWVGAITAVFAAFIAMAQTDIKRILAYSTVSQLGLMFVGLGVGGVAVGMFHLITHAFFKALLFLGSGSVIHSCHEEQDIRKMGGLRKFMPVTFVTYAIGMMALSGVPLLAGFWSKDEIMHKAHEWGPSEIPYYLVLVGAFLTAFYMTRQMAFVFFGKNRAEHQHRHEHTTPHESPAVMTGPLIVLAVCAVFIGFLGTPAWPWFESFVHGHEAKLEWSNLSNALPTMLISIVIAGLGIAAGWGYYGRKPIDTSKADPLQGLLPNVYPALEKRLLVDELYEATVITWQRAWARGCDWLEKWVWQGVMLVVSMFSQVLGWVNRIIDEMLINGGFNASCAKLQSSGNQVELAHRGNIQRALRGLGIALTIIVLLLSWGCSKS